MRRDGEECQKYRNRSSGRRTKHPTCTSRTCYAGTRSEMTSDKFAAPLSGSDKEVDSTKYEGKSYCCYWFIKLDVPQHFFIGINSSWLKSWWITLVSITKCSVHLSFFKLLLLRHWCKFQRTAFFSAWSPPNFQASHFLLKQSQSEGECFLSPMTGNPLSSSSELFIASVQMSRYFAHSFPL